MASENPLCRKRGPKFVLQCTPHLQRSALLASKLWSFPFSTPLICTAVRLLFVPQYASICTGDAFEKIPVVGGFGESRKPWLFQTWLFAIFIGNENSARSFSDRSFFEHPSGHGCPRLWVMDVRTEMLVFPGFRGLDRSFWPRTSAGISAWTSAGYPAPKFTLWAAFSFLILGASALLRSFAPFCALLRICVRALLHSSTLVWVFLRISTGSPRKLDGGKPTGTNDFASFFPRKIIWTKGWKVLKKPSSRHRYEDLISQNLKHGWFSRKVANHIWTVRFVWTFVACPFKTRGTGRKFIWTGWSDVVCKLSREPPICFRLDCRERCWELSPEIREFRRVTTPNVFWGKRLERHFPSPGQIIISLKQEKLLFLKPFILRGMRAFRISEGKGKQISEDKYCPHRNDYNLNSWQIQTCICKCILQN